MPFVYYALLPGSVGYFLVWYSQTGWINAGSLLAAAIAAAAVWLVVRHGGRPLPAGGAGSPP